MEELAGQITVESRGLDKRSFRSNGGNGAKGNGGNSAKGNGANSAKGAAALRCAPPRKSGKTFSLGRHVTIECYECDTRVLNSPQILEQVSLSAVEASGATVVKSHFQPFSPQGVSGIIIISESHFSIHTWPEHRYAAADFFTCGSSIDVERAIEELKGSLRTPSVFVSADMARGLVGVGGVQRCVPLRKNGRQTFTLSWREKFEESSAWGLLTSIDVYRCDPAKIRDADHIRRYVRELCERIDMQRHEDTVVVNFGRDKRVEGFSMTQLIETSLISGHFANQSNAAYIDIFSCKYYEPREAAEFTLKAFGGDRYHMQVALRD